MEKFSKMHYTMFAFIAAGLAFSGYLAATKFFSDTCAFGATCPIFLGYPACYTGFLVYAIISIVAIISLFKKELSRILLVTITGVSFFGVLFSGKLTLAEMSVLFEQGFVPFVKSLPLCSVGLIFYAIIFIISLIIGKDCEDPCCGHCGVEPVKEEPKIETPVVAPAEPAPEVREAIIPAFPQIEEVVNEASETNIETTPEVNAEAVSEVTEEVHSEKAPEAIPENTPDVAKES